MSKSYEKLITLLKQMLQLDQADLDFGIYRIMNYKKREFEKFLNEDLIPQVRTQLEKYLTLKNQLESDVDTEKAEDEVYSPLTDFFSRYYNNGDFISQRRYKQGVYAIPYEGEEVKLYWANADQYYIKTAEHFKDYTFTLPDGKRVHFKLVEASTEKDNNRPAENEGRRFVLYQDGPVKVKNGELVIQFEYKVHKRKQKDVNAEIIKTVIEIFENSKGAYSSFLGIFALSPTEANPKRTILEKHLNNYTARNNFDYFIHKDLGAFLRREHDFYLKNEVMFLDDLDTEHEVRLEQYITKIKVIKNIGYKIIALLEQIENFQKKLWLKKKFVVKANYCITLDRINEEFYPEIAENRAQAEEWKKLFAIEELEGYTEPLTVDFLKENKYLVLDTAFYGEDFKERLIQSIHNIDEKTDGLIIKSENFQALNLILERYKEQVKCVYIDPPYNAKSSEILYKNNFKDSSWLSLMHDRLLISKRFLHNESVCVIAIDEVEQEKLGMLLDEVFPEQLKSNISVIINPSGQQGNYFSTTHEYAYFVYPDIKNIIGLENRSEENADVRGFMNGAKGETENYLRESGENCFYPIIIDPNDLEIVEFGDVPDISFHPGRSNILRDDGLIEVYPVDAEGAERKWLFARQSVEDIYDELSVVFNNRSKQYEIIRTKRNINYKTVWTDKKYSAKTYGTLLLKSLFGKKIFSYPKSLYTVSECLVAATNNNKAAIILDYFAGSGTTAHAVINLNREDRGSRKYILVEMGEYFDTVLKPRVEKVIYSKDWKNGKPVSCKGISHMFKYMKLESYEDTLNNLEIKRSEEQQVVLDLNANVREEYMLSYMLDKEVEGSMPLVNIDAFANPFAYKMKITDWPQAKETAIDLVETFNYLLGLVVARIHAKESFNTERDERSEIPGEVRLIPATDGKGEYTFKEVEGYTLSEGKVLIIWRTMTGDIAKDNGALDTYFRKKRHSRQDFEFSRIYVNGDNNLQNMKKEGERWKVSTIEEEFKRLMFDVQDI